MFTGSCGARKAASALRRDGLPAGLGTTLRRDALERSLRASGLLACVYMRADTTRS
jgi:hypothetical protein